MKFAEMKSEIERVSRKKGVLHIMYKDLHLIKIDGLFGICKLKKGEQVPQWALCKDSLYSITETEDEISILCPQERVPSNIQVEKGWRALKIKEPLDFSLTGVLSSLLAPLTKLKISVFVISTFTTDYLFIKQNRYAQAIGELKKYFNVQT